MVRPPLILVLLAGPVLAQPAAPSLQSLISNSPFGVATVGAPGAAAPSALEFRGTFVDRGERFFSLVDPATRKAEWVGLNEPGRPFTVKSFDTERETVAVEFQGRTLDLKLHSARVVALAPQPAAPVPPAGTLLPPGAAQPRPAVAAGTSEAQRLAQVAEEIRRRRALRQQAQPSGPVQIPGAQPPPTRPQ